jgi:hypothetical protein
VLPLLGVLPFPTSEKPEALSVVVLGGLNDALRDPPGAEGGHEGAVLTTQHDDVGIRLVEVVVELGEQSSLRAPMTWKGTLHTKPRGGDLFEVRGPEQPTLPVKEAHVYGHVFLAPRSGRLSCPPCRVTRRSCDTLPLSCRPLASVKIMP